MLIRNATCGWRVVCFAIYQKRRGGLSEYIILSLCEEFGENSIVFFGCAPYFRGSSITDLAVRDDLEFVTFPF